MFGLTEICELKLCDNQVVTNSDTCIAVLVTVTNTVGRMVASDVGIDKA